jgi:hypothetical protein
MPLSSRSSDACRKELLNESLLRSLLHTRAVVRSLANRTPQYGGPLLGSAHGFGSRTAAITAQDITKPEILS